MAELRERDKQPSKDAGQASAPGTPSASPATAFHAGQRVKVNLSGMQAGGVSFSQNVDAAWATIQSQVSQEPPVYHVELLFSFRGVRELDVPADRIRLL